MESSRIPWAHPFLFLYLHLLSYSRRLLSRRLQYGRLESFHWFVDWLIDKLHWVVVMPGPSLREPFRAEWRGTNLFFWVSIKRKNATLVVGMRLQTMRENWHCVTFLPPGGECLSLPSHNKIYDTQWARKDRQCHGNKRPVLDPVVWVKPGSCPGPSGQSQISRKSGSSRLLLHVKRADYLVWLAS